MSVQDDVRKYIPELPSYGTPIKIIHLLNHTSGLKDWGSIGWLAGWERTTKVYTQDIGLDIIFKQKSLNFTPGSEYSYSNSNCYSYTASNCSTNDRTNRGANCISHTLFKCGGFNLAGK